MNEQNEQNVVVEGAQAKEVVLKSGDKIKLAVFVKNGEERIIKKASDEDEILMKEVLRTKKYVEKEGLNWSFDFMLDLAEKKFIFVDDATYKEVAAKIYGETREETDRKFKERFGSLAATITGSSS